MLLIVFSLCVRVSACADNCVTCNANGAGLCDVCETNYLFDTTNKNCTR